jgi:hypothetical protein
MDILGMKMWEVEEGVGGSRMDLERSGRKERGGRCLEVKVETRRSKRCIEAIYCGVGDI